MKACLKLQQLFCSRENPLASKTKKPYVCLEKKANYIYKKVEQGKVNNANTMKNELEHDLDRKDDNLYKRVVLNKVYKYKDKTPQMENWSIFSDNVRYVQHDEKAPQVRP